MNNQIQLSEDERDCYQEITNVAMGQAADRLARLLGVYVVLPIPNVNIIEVNEFKMTLKSLEGMPLLVPFAKVLSALALQEKRY